MPRATAPSKAYIGATAVFAMKETGMSKPMRRHQARREIVRVPPCVGLMTLMLAPVALAQQAVPEYRDPALPIEQRVADLLSRMTLEEKVEQLYPHRGRHH
jgi:hypothetical protein